MLILWNPKMGSSAFSTRAIEVVTRSLFGASVFLRPLRRYCSAAAVIFLMECFRIRAHGKVHC